MMKRILIAASAVAVAVGGLISIGSSPAAADPARKGVGSGYGASVNLLGAPAINAAGLATATLPPGGNAGPNTLVLADATPIAVSGTAVGSASANVDSILVNDLPQTPPGGPYNVGGIGLLEGLGVLLGGAGGLPLISARAVRAEAVGVCRGTTASYSANSEIVDLRIGGIPLGLNGSIVTLLNTLNTALALLPDPLRITILTNERTVTSEGATVNALHVTALPLAGGAPVLDLIAGRAEASGLECGPPIPECSDTEDNDGDGVIDRNDPGCITNGVFDPNDDDERNECIDGIDNADPEDTLVDFGSDPGCTDPQDDNETDDGGGGGGQILARTGGNDSSSLPLAAGFGVLAFGAMVLRRRSQASR